MRAYGSFPHPNVFGGFLVVAILALFQLKKEGSRSVEVIRPCLLALLSSTLVITFSRSAWLAIAISMSVLVYRLMFPIKKKCPDRVIFSPSNFSLYVVLLSLVITVFFTRDLVFSRFNPSERLESISIEQRVNSYEPVFDLLRRYPIFGVGIGNYSFALTQERPGLSPRDYQPVHNALVLMIVELGLVGVLIILFSFRPFIQSFSILFSHLSSTIYLLFSTTNSPS